jgi:hypothetical protein
LWCTESLNFRSGFFQVIERRKRQRLGAEIIQQNTHGNASVPRAEKCIQKSGTERPIFPDVHAEVHCVPGVVNRAD